MIDIWSPEAFWLTLTNVALGLICLAFVVVVVAAVVADIRERREQQIRRQLGARPMDERARFTPDLGVTMADGGEPVRARPRAGQPSPA